MKEYFKNPHVYNPYELLLTFCLGLGICVFAFAVIFISTFFQN